MTTPSRELVEAAKRVLLLRATAAEATEAAFRAEQAAWRVAKEHDRESIKACHAAYDIARAELAKEAENV